MKNKRLKVLKTEALLISSTPNIYYLTGFFGFAENEREAYLLITQDNNYIFTDGRYTETVKNNVKDFKLIEISGTKNFYESFAEIIKKEKIKKLRVDENDISLAEYVKLRKIIKIAPDNQTVENLRCIKDANEITQIKKTCKLGDQTFEYILGELKAGVSEIEIAKKIEIFILSKNASISFSPIVAFGKNSSSPHHVAGDNKVKKNDIILLDFGVKLNNYCSDMTRTVFFGSAPTKFKKIYQIVFDAQKAAIDLIRKSFYPLPATRHALSTMNHEPLTMNRVDNAARNHIVSEGYASIPHSLGHGIGLEVHEKPSISPKSKDSLTNGMVFSIEPGIYIPGFGGVRIEDLFAFNNGRLKILTNANRQLIEL